MVIVVTLDTINIAYVDACPLIYVIQLNFIYYMISAGRRGLAAPLWSGKNNIPFLQKASNKQKC